MAKSHELSGLIKWSNRDDWADLFDEILDDHFGAVLAAYAIDLETLESHIGEQNMTNLWGCAFEDFLTQPLSQEDPRTIVDDYLKRRGWKESPSTRRYMEALKDSVFSLYEVDDVVPGQSLLLRDLLRSSEPVQATEHTASRMLRKGDRLGCRVVTVSGTHRLAGGLAIFEEQAAGRVVERIGEGLVKMRAVIEREAVEDGETLDPALSDAFDDTILRGLAAQFTAIWIDSALEGRLPKVPPPRFNSDGDELRFHTVTYGLSIGASPQAVADRLDAVPDLCREDDGVWNWIDRRDDDARDIPSLSEPRSEVRDGRLHVELDDGTPVLATLELFEDGLLVIANSAPRADRAKVMVKSVLKGMVGQPQTDVEGADDDEAQS
jgi:hypothetical protein